MKWSEFKEAIDAELDGEDLEIFYIDVHMPSKVERLIIEFDKDEFCVWSG